MTDLRQAAQQALEALLKSHTCPMLPDDCEAAITALKAALAEPVQEPDAYGYASRLAVAIWEKNYKDTSANWKPLNDLMGVLTQIDNMTYGLVRAAEPVQKPVAWRYKGDPWFDGNRWHANFEVTTDERLAKFKDKHATPLYTAPPQRSPEPVQEPVAWRTFDGEGGWDYRSYENNEDYIYQYVKRNGGRYSHWVEPLYTTPPPRYNRSPHDLTEFVNHLCEISNKFAGTTQLHDRIAVQVYAFLKQSSSGEHCGYPNCDGGSMGTYCHTHCEKKF